MGKGDKYHANTFVYTHSDSGSYYFFPSIAMKKFANKYPLGLFIYIEKNETFEIESK
jgi:hypothetical protein